MKRFHTTLMLIGLSLILFGAAASVPAEDESRSLQKLIKDQNAEGADFWIYNDLEAAKEEARKQNKPLFVTFRCVPCQDCKAFDAEVAQGNDVIQELAAQEFIPVRQVEMKGVDLTQFQFDYDLNWAAMFINADGTVYARYGTQSAAGPDAYNSIEGLRNTMLRVLELHRQYPKNSKSLADKRGAKKPYETALEMPELEQREKLRGVTELSNCIHCHNIHDSENRHAYATKKFTRDLLWRYPLPDNIGLEVDAKHGTKIKRVSADSAAAKAGLQAGEEILAMNGQPITSIADVQWVLHNLPNTKTSVTVSTDKSGSRSLALVKGWKESDISWRGSLWSVSPRMNVWSPELTAQQRRNRGLPTDQSALHVRWINRQRPGGKAAFDSGLRTDDVIIAVDGKPLGEIDNEKFQMYVKLNHKPSEKLPITVRRGNREVELQVQLVE